MGDYDFLHEPPYTFGECYEETVEGHVYYNGVNESNISATLRREGNIVSILLHEKYWALPVGSKTGDCFLIANLQKYIYNIDSKFDIHRTRDKYFHGFMKVYDDTRKGNKLKVVPSLIELDNGLLTITAIDQHKKGAQVYTNTEVSLFGIYPTLIQVAINPTEEYEIQPDLDLDGPDGDADSDEEMEVNNWETRTLNAYVNCDAVDMESLVMQDVTFTITLKRNLALNQGMIIIPKILLPIKQQKTDEKNVGSVYIIYLIDDKVEEFFGRLPPFSDGKASFIPTQYYSKEQKKIVSGVGLITFKSSNHILICPNSDDTNEYFITKDRNVDDDDEIGLPEKFTQTFILQEGIEVDDIDLASELDEGVPEDVETSSLYESLNIECTVNCEAWEGIDKKAIFSVYKTKTTPLQAWLKIPAVMDEIRVTDDTGGRNLYIQNCIAQVNDFLGDNYYVNTDTSLGNIKTKTYDNAACTYTSDYDQVLILENGVIQVGNNSFEVVTSSTIKENIGIVKGKIFKLDFEQHGEDFIHKDADVPTDINDTTKYEKHSISCTAACDVWENGSQAVTLTLYTEKNNNTPTKVWLKIPCIMDEVSVKSNDSDCYPLEINVGTHDFAEYLPDGYMMGETDAPDSIHVHAIRRARNEPYDGNFDISVFLTHISISFENVGFCYAMEGYEISKEDKMVGTSCTSIITYNVGACPIPTRGENVPENYNNTSLYTVGEEVCTAICDSWEEGTRDILIKHYLAKNSSGVTYCYIEIPAMGKYILKSDMDEDDHPITIALYKKDMDKWLYEDYEFVYENDVGIIKGQGFNREQDDYEDIRMQVALVEGEGIVLGKDNTGLYKAKTDTALKKFVGASEYTVLAFPIKKKESGGEESGDEGDNPSGAEPENPTIEDLSSNPKYYNKYNIIGTIECVAWGEYLNAKGEEVAFPYLINIYQSKSNLNNCWAVLQPFKQPYYEHSTGDNVNGPINVTLSSTGKITLGETEYTLPQREIAVTGAVYEYLGNGQTAVVENAGVKYQNGKITVYSDVNGTQGFETKNTTQDTKYPKGTYFGIEKDIVIPLTFSILPTTGGETMTYFCNVDCDTLEHHQTYTIQLLVEKDEKKMKITFPQFMGKIHVYDDETETFADVIQINGQDIAKFAGDYFIPSGKLKEDVPVTCYNGKAYVKTTGFIYFDGFCFVIVPSDGLIQHFYATYDGVNADYIGVHEEFSIEFTMEENEPLYPIFDEDEHHKFNATVGMGYITAHVNSVLSANMNYTTQIFVDAEENEDLTVTIFPFTYPILYKAAMGTITIDISEIKTVIGSKLIDGVQNATVSVAYMNSKEKNGAAIISYDSTNGYLVLQPSGEKMFTINGNEGYFTLKELTTITFKAES